MRLLFLSPFDPFVSETGVAHYLRGLSKALCKLGCEVHIMTLDSKNSSRVINGIQIHSSYCSVNPILRIPSIKGYILLMKSFRRINKLCKEYDIDVVHGQPSSWVYGLLYRKNDVPFVATLHATSFGELTSYFDIPYSFVNKNVILALLGELVEASPALIKYRRADKVIAVSKAVAEEASKFYCIPKERIVVIPNGIDLQSFSNFKAKVEEGDEHMILSVGRLVWRKGFKYLIDAMPLVLSEYPNVKLVIVGYGELLMPLLCYAKKLGINNSMHFLGNVSREKLYSLYNKAEIYVQPSLYEPFGITILEAMSMRKPVIATRVGGIPEIITNGVEGLLVEPRNSLQLADAIIHVFSDSSTRERLGNNARKKIERKFTWETIAKKYIEFYNDLLHEKKRP